MNTGDLWEGFLATRDQYHAMNHWTTRLSAVSWLNSPALKFGQLRGQEWRQVQRLAIARRQNWPSRQCRCHRPRALLLKSRRLVSPTSYEGHSNFLQCWRPKGREWSRTGMGKVNELFNHLYRKVDISYWSVTRKTTVPKWKVDETILKWDPSIGPMASFSLNLMWKSLTLIRLLFY